MALPAYSTLMAKVRPNAWFVSRRCKLITMGVVGVARTPSVAAGV
jgi:hypothetical protein